MAINVANSTVFFWFKISVGIFMVSVLISPDSQAAMLTICKFSNIKPFAMVVDNFVFSHSPSLKVFRLSNRWTNRYKDYKGYIRAIKALIAPLKQVDIKNDNVLWSVIYDLHPLDKANWTAKQGLSSKLQLLLTLLWLIFTR